jgi:hypothetical protein
LFDGGLIGVRPTTAALAIVALAAAASASAQTPQDGAAPTLQTPAVSISAGLGPVGRYQGIQWRAPGLLVSAQIQVAPFVIVQGTATGWTWHRNRHLPAAQPDHILFAQADEHWRTLSFGANVGLRGAKGPVAAVIGTGLGFQRSTLLGSTCYQNCDALTPDRPFATNGVVRISPSLQFTGSADLRIAPAIVAFGELLLIAGNEGALGTFAGLRVPIGSRTYPRRFPELFPSVNAVRFEGERVRLTMLDGRRHRGRLVTLSMSEVVLATDATILTVPLQHVRKLEKRARGVMTGALIGLGPGLWVGLGVGEVGSGSTELWPVFAFSAIGAGIGAGIGAVIDVSRADRNLIYLAAGSGGSIGIKPFASPLGSGVELAWRW